jgi:hypothetical protein
MKSGRWAYSLENGNVGVYKKKTRLWRVKAKFRPVQLVHIILDEKTSYLGIGWQKGKVEIRNDSNGEILHKIVLENNIS